jgi:hypothetical protein
VSGAEDVDNVKLRKFFVAMKRIGSSSGVQTYGLVKE